MRRIFLSLATLLLALSTSACSRTIWIKDGSTRSDFEQMKAACLVEGFEKIPMDERTVQLSNGGYQTTKECTQGRRSERCEKITEYVPPQYTTYDKNEDVRAQVVRACFYRNGWNEVEVK